MLPRESEYLPPHPPIAFTAITILTTAIPAGAPVQIPYVHLADKSGNAEAQNMSKRCKCAAPVTSFKLMQTWCTLKTCKGAARLRTHSFHACLATSQHASFLVILEQSSQSKSSSAAMTTSCSDLALLLSDLCAYCCNPILSSHYVSMIDRVFSQVPKLVSKSHTADMHSASPVYNHSGSRLSHLHRLGHRNPRPEPIHRPSVNPLTFPSSHPLSISQHLLLYASKLTTNLSPEQTTIELHGSCRTQTRGSCNLTRSATGFGMSIVPL